MPVFTGMSTWRLRKNLASEETDFDRYYSLLMSTKVSTWVSFFSSLRRLEADGCLPIIAKPFSSTCLPLVIDFLEPSSTLEFDLSS